MKIVSVKKYDRNLRDNVHLMRDCVQNESIITYNEILFTQIKHSTDLYKR